MPDNQESALQVIDRRTFLLRLAGVSATITLIGAGLGYALRRDRSSPLTTSDLFPPPADPSVPGASPPDLPIRAAFEPAPGTRPELSTLKDHYAININILPPSIDGSAWRLPVTGLLENPLLLDLSDFFGETFGEPVHEFITLMCVSNTVGGDLIDTIRWSGVPLQRVLDQAGLLPEARFLRISSADRYHETLALDLVRDEPRIMLAYMWEGRPLSVGHGYPLRVYIPDRYGMKQPKWITGIEAVADYEDGYWVSRGWDQEARIKATSIIDTIAVDAAYEDGGAQVIPVGGIAFAGARGISRVELQVDDGPWQPAELRQPLSDLTWVQWRYDWLFSPGKHTLTVRCMDGTGTAQIITPAPPHPSGASGLYDSPINL